MKKSLWILGAVALAALVAAPALAAEWTHRDYESSWTGDAYLPTDTGNRIVAGTWTRKTSSSRKYEDGQYHNKGHATLEFVSTDGTIKGKGVRNWNRRWTRPAGTTAQTFTSTYHINWTERGEGLINRTRYVRHTTYNANGELTADVWNRDIL